jgi:hypothetical protein
VDANRQYDMAVRGPERDLQLADGCAPIQRCFFFAGPAWSRLQALARGGDGYAASDASRADKLDPAAVIARSDA